MSVDRFDGWIAGLGSARGPRVVIGRWPRSPLGDFADVMLEWPDGHRRLLAPTPEIADYVSRTYRFDEVTVVPVSVVATPGPGHRARGGCWRVEAGPLRVELRVGGRPLLGRLLRAVPRPLATARPWLRLVDLIAARVMPGVRARGSAAGGRREWYAALDMHRVAGGAVTWDGVDQGPVVPVHPPVRFGFGSTPAAPSLVRVVSLVELPDPPR